MVLPTVRLLHVEDDPVQQRLMSFHLRALDDLTFEITWATSEEEAVATFREQGADLVLLDYHLTEGNGLRVLERIRRLDPLVPVIAISGVALAETAAELVQAGADDFLHKRDLTGPVLAGSVRAALLRARQVRQRLVPREAARPSLEEQFVLTCAGLRQACEAIQQALDAFTPQALQARQHPESLYQLFEMACAAYDLAHPTSDLPGRILLRPVWLELRERLGVRPTGQTGNNGWNGQPSN